MANTVYKPVFPFLPALTLLAALPTDLPAAERPVRDQPCRRVRQTLPYDDPALVEFRKWLEKRGSYKPATPVRSDRTVITIRGSDARKLPDKLEAQQWKNLETIFSK